MKGFSENDFKNALSLTKMLLKMSIFLLKLAKTIK